MGFVWGVMSGHRGSPPKLAYTVRHNDCSSCHGDRFQRRSHHAILCTTVLLSFAFVLTCPYPYDLERLNGRVFCVISPTSVAFGVYYVKVVEETPIHSASEM